MIYDLFIYQSSSSQHNEKETKLLQNICKVKKYLRGHKSYCRFSTAKQVSFFFFFFAASVCFNCFQDLVKITNIKIEIILRLITVIFL